MSCKQCGSDLTCRIKDYGGNYAPSLQWQNKDGSAHYKTVDGKNFNCYIPEETSPPQQTFTPIPPTTPGTNPPLPPNPQMGEILTKVNDMQHLVTRIYEMTEAIFRYTVDNQLRSNEPNS